MLGRLCFAFQELRKQLLKGVHAVVREHLFENPVTARVQSLQEDAAPYHRYSFIYFTIHLNVV